jgi:hypothetical protein
MDMNIGIVSEMRQSQLLNVHVAFKANNNLCSVVVGINLTESGHQRIVIEL